MSVKSEFSVEFWNACIILIHIAENNYFLQEQAVRPNSVFDQNLKLFSNR